MSEAKDKKPVEEVIDIAVVKVEKPYEFRKLGAPDIFLMTKIISTIGIKEFKACVESDAIKDMVNAAMVDEKGNGNSNIISIGAGVVLEIANVILCNLHKCENDIYQMLAQTSNLSVDEIKAPGNAVMFFEMVVDFVKKEEFRDFIQVVSRLFK